MLMKERRYGDCVARFLAVKVAKVSSGTNAIRLVLLMVNTEWRIDDNVIVFKPLPTAESTTRWTF